MADLITPTRAMRLPALSGADATYIAALITAASDRVERYCACLFTSAERTEKYNGDGSDVLFLRVRPIISITEVKVTDSDGTVYTVAAASLLYNSRTGELRFSPAVSDVSGVSRFLTGFQNVSVKYIAGYATIPEQVQEAVAQLVLCLYSAAGKDASVSAWRLGDYSETRMAGLADMAEGVALPGVVRMLLTGYKLPGGIRW